MTISNLNKLRSLIEEAEKDEGLCYKRRSECTSTCPFWFSGEFGTNICLTSALGRRVARVCFGKNGKGGGFGKR